MQRKEEVGSPHGRNDKGKEKSKLPSFRLFLEIEQAKDLKKVMEERILNSRMEFTLREVLGIAKR